MPTLATWVARPERADHIGKRVAGYHRAYLARRVTHGLHDQRYSPRLDIGIGYGKRNTLTPLIGYNYHKMAWFTRFGDHWRLNHELDYFFRKILFIYDPVHDPTIDLHTKLATFRRTAKLRELNRQFHAKAFFDKKPHKTGGFIRIGHSTEITVSITLLRAHYPVILN